MTIATILMTSLVVRQRRWGDQLYVNTQAYELALAIRQAQIDSLAVKVDLPKSGNKFDVSYGVYIDKDAPNGFIYFSDRNGSNSYEPGEQFDTETLMNGSIGKLFKGGVTVEMICGVGGPNPCSNSGPLDNLTILFKRPQTAAKIYFRNNGGNTVNGVNPPATIYLRSISTSFINNYRSSVKIDASGQISIANQ